MSSDHKSSDHNMELFHQLMTRLMNSEGSLEQAEDWFAQIQQLVATSKDEYLHSEGMTNLEEVMAVRRRAATLTQDGNTAAQRPHLTSIIQQIMNMQRRSDLGEDIDLAEFEACFTILRAAVPGPPWADLILKRKETKTPEEVLDQAYELRSASPKTIRL